MNFDKVKFTYILKSTHYSTYSTYLGPGKSTYGTFFRIHFSRSTSEALKLEWSLN